MGHGAQQVLPPPWTFSGSTPFCSHCTAALAWAAVISYRISGIASSLVSPTTSLCSNSFSTAAMPQNQRLMNQWGPQPLREVQTLKLAFEGPPLQHHLGPSHLCPSCSAVQNDLVTRTWGSQHYWPLGASNCCGGLSLHCRVFGSQPVASPRVVTTKKCLQTLISVSWGAKLHQPPPPHTPFENHYTSGTCKSFGSHPLHTSVKHLCLSRQPRTSRTSLQPVMFTTACFLPTLYSRQITQLFDVL